MGTTSARRPPSTLQTAAIALSDSGDIVAAVASKKILIWEITLTNDDEAQSVIFKSGTTPLTGAMYFPSFRASVLSNGDNAIATRVPLFETAAGEAFVATLSSAANLGGRVIYSLEDA